MSGLSGRKILLGVSGGIAAYKTPLLIRSLLDVGAEVQVVMTRAATHFVTPLTLQTVSNRPVYRDLMDPGREAALSHIELARWADLVLVAPATADFMARLAHGLGDDLLSTLCLATRARIALAPAMNLQMWMNPATQANRSLLEGRGMLIWGPGEGPQACGEHGAGRMLEPRELVHRVQTWSGSVTGVLSGVSALVTAGPTHEPIDPVRFIGNRSSGKMGYALAAALAELGAEVYLVSGPVALACPVGVRRNRVETAAGMFEMVMQKIEDSALFVAAAAVADYRPSQVAARKIKKTGQNVEIMLEPNPDILAAVAELPDPPFTVGFAAETERVEEQAEIKRLAKGIDMIAANLVNGREGGFDRDENAVTLLWDGGMEAFPLMPKTQLAQQLAARIADKFHAKSSAKDT